MPDLHDVGDDIWTDAVWVETFGNAEMVGVPFAYGTDMKFWRSEQTIMIEWFPTISGLSS